ncbi:GFA family protein [Halomonas sp. GD1P12]|uniref:GFA family protein n=1 Tax=Halomonas sp. GD1P12 TaxID=2982691 RepID=UPI0021E36FFE|nr:GFA family protein [Halomonas sp. GD1P12]UYG01359.1 GFA family protein [Halomonas sp. GD1P12]
METLSEHQGRCVCGAVSITARPESLNVDVCHCATCRQWSGGPLMVASCGTRVDFEGEERISTFASSEWAQRGFCSGCGTHLFFRLNASGEYLVPVGLLQSDGAWRLKSQVFIDQKPAFYSFCERTHDLTGEELFAKHA